ncbi:MAG TPA: PAS domain S-box protein, partial [Chthoniobacterales bacterium]|nr:PAS domain S-box protein [Chthoniobacterales bacterium]
MNLIDPENIVREQSEDPPERGAKSNNSPVAKQSKSQPVDDSPKDTESEQQRNRPIDRVAVNFVDLTKRGATAEDLQKTVQALERQTRVLDTTLSSIVDFAYTFDKEGRFVFANRPLADLLQLTPDEMVGKNFFELGYPEDLAAKLQRQIREVFETKAIVRDETPFTSPAGATGYYEYIFLPVLAGDGTVGAVAGSTRDVTKRKMAEEGLRASEERFRQFAENSADLVWIIDAERQQLEYLSPAFEKMWGESRGAVMHNLVRWSDLVHPDDRETVTKALPRLRAGETVVIDYRIIRPSDGEVRWIRDTGFPIRDQAGEIRRLGGIARDITGERDRGEALRESEERFRVLVEGARDYAMFLLDPSNEITYWSKGAERVFGWSAEEAVGQSGELVFTSEDRAVEQEEKEIEKALRDGSASDRRWHLRKDGSRFWVDGVMRRLDDEKTGALRGFAKVARDASDQRDAEDALRHARDELEQRVLERTAELMTMNNELQSAMNTRRQLER